MELQRIGPYRIVRMLGEGGMGSVYEAVHEEIARSVAIKILRPADQSDPEDTARLLNEARAVNIIRHRSIVGIHDCGRLPDGSPYIVMDYLEGETLRAAMRRGCAQQTLLRLVRQVASTLAAVHAKSIVHRDLKPDNVMLIEDSEVPGGKRAILFDFGIAKLSTEQKHPETLDHKTDVRFTVGTATYMSPEQAAMDLPITDRTDVYALGIMLYEIVGGAPPFSASTFALLLDMHRFSAPISLERLAPGIDRGLAELVASMLAKSPSERPSMNQVAAGLERILTPASDAGIHNDPTLTPSAAGRGKSAPPPLPPRKNRPTEPTPFLSLDAEAIDNLMAPPDAPTSPLNLNRDELLRAAKALLNDGETAPIPRHLDPEMTPSNRRHSNQTLPLLRRPGPMSPTRKAARPEGETRRERLVRLRREQGAALAEAVRRHWRPLLALLALLLVAFLIIAALS